MQSDILLSRFGVANNEAESVIMFVQHCQRKRYGNDVHDFRALLSVGDIKILFRKLFIDWLSLDLKLAVWSNQEGLFVDISKEIGVEVGTSPVFCKEGDVYMHREWTEFEVINITKADFLTDELLQHMVFETTWVMSSAPLCPTAIRRHELVPVAPGSQWVDVTDLVMEPLIRESDIVIVPGHDSESLTVAGRKIESYWRALLDGVEARFQEDCFVSENKDNLIYDEENCLWNMVGPAGS